MKSTPTLLLALFGVALAQGASPLRLTLTQERVTTVTENGKATERLTPLPKTVQPGDVLTQQLTAQNVGKSTLRNAALTLPVPQGTVYLGGAGAGEGWSTLFSRDGGKTFGQAPLKKLVTVTEDGKTFQKEVVVPPSEYTTVRWVVSALKPDTTLKLGFRVKVK